MRRYVRKELVTLDRKRRVLLSEVLAVARRKKRHGRSIAACDDRRQASRVLNDVLAELRLTKNSAKAAARFIKYAQTDAWRTLPDNPPLEQGLVHSGLTRMQVLVLTARFISECSRKDIQNPSLPTRPTKREVQDARYLRVWNRKLKEWTVVKPIAGELTLCYVPGRGVFVKRGTAPGEVPTREEAVRINTLLESTALSSHARNMSRGSYDQRPRKRGYTLFLLLGWSRQRAKYWRRQTDALWPWFYDSCRAVLKEATKQTGAKPRRQRPVCQHCGKPIRGDPVDESFCSEQCSNAVPIVCEQNAPAD